MIVMSCALERFMGSNEASSVPGTAPAPAPSRAGGRRTYRRACHNPAANWPDAPPFVFNALKINSTLALISAIVAEFFGSPIVGPGFRISTEVARMNVDMVWAAIALAALAGSLFYGAVALAERALTSWHASFRT